MTIEWHPPAGGTWELETIHVRGAQPLVFQERAPRAFRAGFRAAAVRYGLPIDGVDIRFVNDHCYARMVVVGEPEPKPGKAATPPPNAVLWILARVHPELRRRAKAARRALRGRIWIEDLERWQRTQRGDMLAAGRTLHAESVEQLDDAGLSDHLHRVLEHFELGCALHFELLPMHGVPVGRLLNACRRWGIAPGEAMALLAGSSPASVASSAAVAQIAEACAAAGVHPTSLDDVRGASPAARHALDEFLVDHAWRAVTQYSPKGLTLIELPDALLRAINVARPRDDAPVGPPDPAPLRSRVAADERDHFDDLLADARRCYGARDDNVGITFLWPAGLVRRAVLEVGRRLVQRGLLDEQDHALALGEAELAAALSGNAVVASAATRRVEQMANSELEAPSRLGAAQGRPPDPSLFPRAMAELVRSITVEFELEDAFQDGRADANPAWTGSGTGIGASVYTGRACVAASPEDALERLLPGDVLVTTHTTPTFDLVLSLAGAVVTENGGLLSHAAIACRERGLPGVLGVHGATLHIVDGNDLTVDPVHGIVRPAQQDGRTRKTSDPLIGPRTHIGWPSFPQPSGDTAPSPRWPTNKRRQP